MNQFVLSTKLTNHLPLASTILFFLNAYEVSMTQLSESSPLWRPSTRLLMRLHAGQQVGSSSLPIPSLESPFCCYSDRRCWIIVHALKLLRSWFQRLGRPELRGYSWWGSLNCLVRSRRMTSQASSYKTLIRLWLLRFDCCYCCLLIWHKRWKKAGIAF